jgi:site-specific recombinase XerD
MPLACRIIFLVTTETPEANTALLRSFTRTLRIEQRTASTQRCYLDSARLLASFYPDRNLEDLSRDDLAEFLDDQSSRFKAATVATRFRSLRRMYNWMTDEEIIERSPMDKLHPPKIIEPPVPIFSNDELTRLLKATEGREFIQRRDHALLWLLIDCGLRVSEIAGLKVADVDLDNDVVHVMGKGRKSRAVPFSPKPGRALDRYLRERSKHKLAKLPDLWLGGRGQALTKEGIEVMIRTRGRQAGVEHAYPHRFRHTCVHLLRSNGIDDDSLMRLMGWESRSMLHRYAASGADARALQAEADRILGLWQERLIKDQDRCILKTNMLDAMNAWLKNNGHNEWSKETFGPRFEQHAETKRNGVEVRTVRNPQGLDQFGWVKIPARATVYQGVRFRTDSDDLLDETPPDKGNGQGGMTGRTPSEHFSDTRSGKKFQNGTASHATPENDQPQQVISELLGGETIKEEKGNDQ